jgi:hypothetical protein
MFAVGNNDPKLVRLGASGRPLDVTPYRRQPPATAAYVAGEVSARVRERVWREALHTDTLYVDTDGVIMTAHGTLPPFTQDDAPDGHWRVSHNMRVCQIKAAQAYRWIGYDDSEHYVVAGLADAGPQTFKNLPTADALWIA